MEPYVIPQVAVNLPCTTPFFADAMELTSKGAMPYPLLRRRNNCILPGNVGSGRLFVFSGHTSGVVHCAYNQNGTQILSVDRGTVQHATSAIVDGCVEMTLDCQVFGSQGC